MRLSFSFPSVDRLFTSLTFSTFCFLGILFPLFASAQNPGTAKTDVSSKFGSSGTSCTNPSTGFQKIIEDKITVITGDDPTCPVGVSQASDISDHLNNLYLFFGTVLLVLALTKYITGGSNLSVIVEAVIMLVMVRLIMVVYPTLTTALWQWSIGVGDMIQAAAMGCSGSCSGANDWAVFEKVLQLLTDIMSGIVSSCSISGPLDIGGLIGCLGAISQLPQQMLAVAVVVILGLILSILVGISYVWSFWGYIIAKVVGVFFIPFIMFPKLAFLFDGWLKFFFGFLIYGIITRVVSIMVGEVITNFFGSATAIKGMLTDPISMIGLMVFMIISIVSLVSIGKFASTIVSGAGGGGIGGAVMQAANLASKAVKPA